MYKRVKADLMGARRASDVFSRSNLTVLLAEFQKESLAELKADRNYVVPDDKCLAVLKNQIKSLRKGYEDSAAEELLKQAEFLEQYLPQQVSEEELRMVLSGCTSPKVGMPLVNKLAKDTCRDVDRSLASRIIKENADGIQKV